MESLNREAMEDGDENVGRRMAPGYGNQHQQPQQENRLSWKVMAIVLAVVAIIGIYVESHEVVDKELVVTDITELPNATNVERVDAAVQQAEAEKLSILNGTMPPKEEAPKENNEADPGKVEEEPSVEEQKEVIKKELSKLEANEEPGFKHPPWYFSDTYQRRARRDRQNVKETISTWGEWKFLDALADSRPHWSVLEQLFDGVENKDLPREKFPPNSWQTDPVYLNSFLFEAQELVDRAMLAMLAEYGHYDPSSPKPSEEELDVLFKGEEKNSPAFMFNTTARYPGAPRLPKYSPGNGGYASQNWYDQVQRYMLHAIMTQDQFLISMGGHSSAAGHGNHFAQSYTLQLQRSLEPIFARLGVFHQCRNIGMGGLGTSHNALASQSIYGGDNDILMWDSSMTERDGKVTDLFERQAYLGGSRVPALIGAPYGPYYDYKYNVGQYSSMVYLAGSAGLQQSTDIKQVETLPYAMRWSVCSRDFGPTCRSREYNGVCWIERDNVTPAVKQIVMGGRAK